MKMDKSFKPELAVGNGARLAMNQPYLDIETTPTGERVGRIVATSGTVLVVIPVELDPVDIAGSIPCSAFVSARKQAKSVGNLEIICNGECKLLDGSTIPRPDTDRFPNWRGIVPKVKEPIAPVESVESTDSPVDSPIPDFEITLDPTLLLAISKAMGADKKITLKIPNFGSRKIPAHNRPITLSCDNLVEFALLMPMVTIN